MQTKTCTKCGEEKTVTEFQKDKKGKYGVHSRCKECKREYRQQPEVKRHTSKYQREYYQQVGIKEYRREYKREYRQNPDIRNRIRKRDRENRRELRAMGLLSNQHVDITKKHATRSGDPWSDAEMKFLMSSDLPLTDIALELGRKYHSVRLKRSRLRKKLESQQ